MRGRSSIVVLPAGHHPPPTDEILRSDVVVIGHELLKNRFGRCRLVTDQELRELERGIVPITLAHDRGGVTNLPRLGRPRG